MPAYLSSENGEFKERALELLDQIGLKEFANEYPEILTQNKINRLAKKAEFFAKGGGIAFKL